MRAIALLSALLFSSAAYLEARCHTPPPPRIDFLGAQTGCSPLAGQCTAGEPINFFAKTANGSSFAACDHFDWDFNDGSPHSSLQNPTHIFVRPGTFTVALLISNDSGVDGTTKPVVLTVGPTVLFFRVSASTVGSGRTVVFSWDTTNTPNGIRIENVHPSAVPAAVKFTSPLSIGETSLTAVTTMSYTLTALGAASSYTTPTPITVVVVGPSKGRAVRH